MNNREEQIRKCVQEIEEVCKKYNLSLNVEEHIDYDWDENPYVSGNRLVLEELVDRNYISWDYYQFANENENNK